MTVHAAETTAGLFSLHGRRALVTGGSTGIGRVAVETYAAHGADVAFTYASAVDARLGLADAAEEAVQAVEREAREARAIDVDLAWTRERTMGALEAGLGGARVDVLVLNASVQIPELLAEITEAALAAQLRVNLESAFWLLQRLVPPMVERGWGRVLAVSSVQEAQPRAEMPVYAATKSALSNVMRNLARAHARDGVTFNTLQPGLIETSRNLWRREPERAAEWEALRSRVNPMRRAGREEELAGALLWLAAPSSSFVTGAEIAVTGGGHIP